MANGKFLWPSIETPAKATQAMRDGSSAAALSALLTAGIGIAAIYLGHPVFGFDAWSLVDAALLAVVAWRVYRQSLPWSIAGLVIFTLGRMFTFMDNPRLSSLLVSVLFLFYYVNAVRGGLYFRTARRTNPAPISSAEVKSASEDKTSGNPTVEIGAGRMPESTGDEYSEFLAYMKRGDRKFQKARSTLQDEYAAWLKDHRKTAALAKATGD